MPAVVKVLVVLVCVAALGYGAYHLLLAVWLGAQDVSTMKVWWVLSVILVTLTLVLLVLAWTESMPFALQALSVVLVPLWAIALIYFVFGRR